MKRQEISTRIRWVPAWALSLFAAFFSAVVLSVLKDYVDEPLTYVIWSLMLVISSFLICIIHPGHIWKVPLLCNILVILPAACDNSFWTTSFGLIIGTGVVLSFIGAQIGALIGRHINKKDSIDSA
jgi:VIT1/CCC1 family predicted Fe2+/Mn2+ transporter